MLQVANGTGVEEMTSPNQFNAFVASRGEGLHPKLRELLERAAASPFSEVAIRQDGMLQAGTNPESEAAASRVNVTLFQRESTNPAANDHEPETRKFRKQVR
jgi:hypothetical protein